MPITSNQHQAILATVGSAVGANARQYLFGLEVGDSKRGGEIEGWQAQQRATPGLRDSRTTVVSISGIHHKKSA